jgi:5-methyltetrahydrofolate--homocysteine methyltransferase
MMSYQVLMDAVIKGDIKTAKQETTQGVQGGMNPQDILDKGLIAAMDEVGAQFSKGLMFVPQMLRSAKCMQECVELLKPHFKEGGAVTKGRIVLGTVKGDLHDIGKNLVAMMLEGAGFSIIDLGVDVTPKAFV